jgi:hypothetical protein
MALPASGTLGLARIAATDGANSVGVVTPYTLGQLTALTGVAGYWDGGWFWNQRAISAFYSYPGYGFKYGSPSILHDFGLSTRFPTSSSSIIDTSGNSRTGTFVTGTGNGTATNITGYTQTYPAYINAAESGQYSVRLDDIAKFPGTSSYTAITWFRVSSFGSSYPGLIAAEGRSGSNPIGWSCYITNTPNYSIFHTRYSGTSGTGTFVGLTFGSGGVPAFQFNKWYMVAAKYDGTIMSLSLYVDGSRFDAYASNNYSLASDASWGCFQGLRYNNWLNGRFGYTAIYSSSVNVADIDNINSMSRQRYEV